MIAISQGSISFQMSDGAGQMGQANVNSSGQFVGSTIGSFELTATVDGLTSSAQEIDVLPPTLSTTQIAQAEERLRIARSPGVLDQLQDPREHLFQARHGLSPADGIPSGRDEQVRLMGSKGY